jgi:hypothetical protein
MHRRALVESGLCTPDLYALLNALRERCRLAVATAFGESDLYHSGALLSRIIGGGTEACRRDKVGAGGPCDSSNSKTLEPPSYSHIHVDKCSIPSYDLSAILYLSGPELCEGGSFAFVDPDGVDRLVQPRPGRLLAFTSGVENVHQVCEVERGERLVMAMWFTLSDAHQQPPEDLHVDL